MILSKNHDSTKSDLDLARHSQSMVNNSSVQANVKLFRSLAINPIKISVTKTFHRTCQISNMSNRQNILASHEKYNMIHIVSVASKANKSLGLIKRNIH